MAVGYQLKENMPWLARRRFPPAGHRLYETEDEVAEVAMAAGFGFVVQLPSAKGHPGISAAIQGTCDIPPRWTRVMTRPKVPRHRTTCASATLCRWQG
jgi:hypothetical protein